MTKRDQERRDQERMSSEDSGSGAISEVGSVWEGWVILGWGSGLGKGRIWKGSLRMNEECEGRSPDVPCARSSMFTVGETRCDM